MKWLKKNKNEYLIAVVVGRELGGSSPKKYLGSMFLTVRTLSNTCSIIRKLFFSPKGAEWPLCHCSVVRNTDYNRDTDSLEGQSDNRGTS